MKTNRAGPCRDKMENKGKTDARAGDKVNRME